MKRVVIAMSGGVDSSVAALLLQKQGYDLTGVYVIGYHGEAGLPCRWPEEAEAAATVARQLGIPFLTIDLSKEYQKEVIDEFFREYQRGRTPNPDVLCNSKIKFKALIRAIESLKPDFIATGHYAKVANYKTRSIICQPQDKRKDQTYFLWQIDPSVVSRLLFPLENLLKPEVREIARETGLTAADKKDSQGICFIGQVSVKDFLRRRFSPQEGEAITIDGKVIARHRGAVLYTIGERLGAGSVSWTGDVPPLYVLEKDLASNRLIVGAEAALYHKFFEASQSNWFIKPQPDRVYRIRIRHCQQPVEASVTVKNEKIFVQAIEPIRAIAPGQSLAVYDNQILIGGAIIDRVLKS